MKFWPIAILLTALLLGGWVATHSPVRPPDPDWLGHFSGIDAQGRGFEIVLHASTDTPGGVDGRWRHGGEESWEIAQGTIQRSTLTLSDAGVPRLSCRFREERDGSWVLHVGSTRLVRVIAHSTFRL